MIVTCCIQLLLFCATSLYFLCCHVLSRRHPFQFSNSRFSKQSPLSDFRKYRCTVPCHVVLFWWISSWGSSDRSIFTSTFCTLLLQFLLESSTCFVLVVMRTSPSWCFFPSYALHYHLLQLIVLLSSSWKKSTEAFLQWHCQTLSLNFVKCIISRSQRKRWNLDVREICWNRISDVSYRIVI